MTVSFRANRRLWPPLVGSVPMLVGAFFFVKIASSDHYGFQGLDILIAASLAVCGLFIVALNLLAASRRPTAAFIGGLVGIGVSLLLTYGVTQVADTRFGVAAVLWCAANTGAVLYAVEGGPVSLEVDSI